MTTEPFLINPYRVRRRRRVRHDDNPRGLPSRLLSRMMRKYGRRRGMREAWAKYRQGVRRNEPAEFSDNVWFGDPVGHRRAALRGWRTRRLLSRNPLGGEVMIVSNNPRKRRRRRSKGRIRRRAISSRGSLISRLLGRRGRRRGKLALFADNPARRRYRRRRVRYYDNPRKRRRAVAMAAALPAVSFSKPASLIMPALVGTAGYLVTDRVPSMVNVTQTLPRLGVKAAVGFAGGILISKFLGRTSGAVWAIGAAINLTNDVLRTYVFRTSTVAGLGAFPRRGVTYSGQGMGAYPSEYDYSSYPM